MIYLKLRKIVILIIASYFILSCGYQPILNKDSQRFSMRFNFEGNKRLGGLLKNNLIIPKGNENSLTLTWSPRKNSSFEQKSNW